MPRSSARPTGAQSHQTPTLAEICAGVGISLEQLAEMFAEADGQAGLDMFMANCRALAAAKTDPHLVGLAERAVAIVRAQRELTS